MSKFLVVTNLYPPQELGGYGRSIADFVDGLVRRGHDVEVITSDAPYLCDSTIPACTSQQPRITRSLLLLGSFQDGLSVIHDSSKCRHITKHNLDLLESLLDRHWDGFLIGNTDLLSPQLLHRIVLHGAPVIHHIGFIEPPLNPSDLPRSKHYSLVAASDAVKRGLLDRGFYGVNPQIVYPGVKADLFGSSSHSCSSTLNFASTYHSSSSKYGSPSNPVKIGFAGLIMETKGLHTLIEALCMLRQRGYIVQVGIAGDTFQPAYRQAIDRYLIDNNLTDSVVFFGRLCRTMLTRFWDLHHIGVFPSIYPEAFGIVAAEVMASGLCLVSSGVGGASELFDEGKTGLRFTAGDAHDLTRVLLSLINDFPKMHKIASSGQEHARNILDLHRSIQIIEHLLTL